MLKRRLLHRKKMLKLSYIWIWLSLDNKLGIIFFYILTFVLLVHLTCTSLTHYGNSWHDPTLALHFPPMYWIFWDCSFNKNLLSTCFVLSTVWGSGKTRQKSFPLTGVIFQWHWIGVSTQYVWFWFLINIDMF